MRDYEFTFIVQPNLEDEDRTALVEQVQTWITEAGGNVVKVDHWGQRKLAYPIEDYEQGYYVLMNVQMTGEEIRELERRMQISEPVLRYLTVRTEE